MLTRPIRTGLLQRVDNDDLVKLIASFINCDNRDAVAQGYIHEVGQFPKQQLLDGGFWWEDNYYRKNGTRYKPVPNKHKRDRPHSDANNIDGANVSLDETINEGKQTVTEVVCDSETGQSTTRQDPADHMWDDVLHAIRDDLRALWGLWDTDIAPRLDSGLPVTQKDAEDWKGDNVDVVRVLARLRSLTSQVKIITDTYVPKTSIEERVFYIVNSLLAKLNREQEDRDKLCMFVYGIVVYADVPDFVYPRPVD